MLRTFVRASVVVLLPVAAFSQSAEIPPAFDAADVHVSALTATPQIRGGMLGGGRYEMRNATMLDLIRLAWDIDANKVMGRPAWLDADRGDRVIGGPSWLDADRFDVIARAPISASPEAVRAMLRTLLVQRFNLAIHDDKRPLPVYVLTTGKNPKLKKADESGPTDCRPSSEPGERSLSCRNVTMALFAQTLQSLAPEYFDNPVMDSTGLEGGWDLNLKWADRGVPGSSGISIFDAVDTQLGLTLALQNVPMAVVVVDRVNRKPIDNPSGVAERLSAATSEFDVADIKPTMPDSTERGLRLQPGGRVTIQGMTLSSLITVAWDITPDMLAEAPKWLDADRFDIVAKAPSANPPSNQPLDIDAFRPMLRALLIDRFKLATHNEEQPVPVWALMPGKREPTLKKGNLSARAVCRYTTTPQAGASTNSPLTSGYTCENTTMAQLAEKLRGWAPAYVDHVVVDLTGLEGGWDFVLRWTPKRNIPLPQASGSGGMAAMADPSGGITIFEAIDKELGLKLEMQKHSMPVLVIDHVERKPTDN